eukprot:4062337-Prymnesium_polylepis.1
MSIDEEYDTKKYTACRPWYGKKGPTWFIFKPAFEEALHKVCDNFSSLHQHMVTQTDVGGANGPALPAAAAMPSLNFQAT